MKMSADKNPIIKDAKPNANAGKKGWLSYGASNYYRIAFLEFLDTTVHLVFTVFTKFVFAARDGLLSFLSMLQSVFLIPLDFLLIIAHSGLTFIQKDIVQRKKKKWTTGSTEEGTETAIDLKQKLDAFQNVHIADLNNTRKLFWTGEPLSIRSMFIVKDGDSNEPALSFLSGQSRTFSDPPIVVDEKHSATKQGIYSG